MITSRIHSPYQWAKRYQTAAGGLAGLMTERGRSALYGELESLMGELVGSVAGVELAPEDIERPDLLTVVSAARLALGQEAAPDPAPMVPLSQLVKLARLVIDLNRAQEEYFKAWKHHRFGDHTPQRRYARQCVTAAVAVAREVLQRGEQPCLPGMGGD